MSGRLFAERTFTNYGCAIYVLGTAEAKEHGDGVPSLRLAEFAKF